MLLLFSSEFRVQFEKEMEKESQGRSRLAPTIKETQEETKSENRRTFWYRKCFNACSPVGQHLSCKYELIYKFFYVCPIIISGMEFQSQSESQSSPSAPPDRRKEYKEIPLNSLNLAAQEALMTSQSSGGEKSCLLFNLEKH